MVGEGVRGLGPRVRQHAEEVQRVVERVQDSLREPVDCVVPRLVGGDGAAAAHAPALVAARGEAH